MADQKPSPAMFMDLYELTMAQVYWKSSMTASATFSLFIRSYPPDRAYYVLAGVQDVLEYLEGFEFSDGDIEALRAQGRFAEGFLDFLGQLRFRGGVRAMPEGTIFFANEPVLEVTAPIVEAQVVETLLINQINLQSVLATKASRVVHAARGRMVVDFGARRAQGIDAANKLARVSYMAGFSGTSNVMAGELYGIPHIWHDGPLLRPVLSQRGGRVSSLRRLLSGKQHISRGTLTIPLRASAGPSRWPRRCGGEDTV